MKVYHMCPWKKKIVNHSWQNEPISMYKYINIENVKVFLILSLSIYLFVPWVKKKVSFSLRSIWSTP